MSREKESQIHRILSMYDRLEKGEKLVKKEESQRFQTSDKSIQRDINHIRRFLELEKNNAYLDYNRKEKVYQLSIGKDESRLNSQHILAILKVLMDSRAFKKDEMDSIVSKLLMLVNKKDQEILKKMTGNERLLYTDLSHGQAVIEKIWTLSEHIQNQHIMTITYQRELADAEKEHLVKPVGIIFSEYYFYLLAYPANKEIDYPIIYRIDRIKSIKTEQVSFKIPYSERFQEGEFRKRVQFMYTGDLLKVKFKFTGASKQAVLDRLPTAKEVMAIDDGWIFEAEVFGKGIKMWLMSQGEHVEVLEPKAFREEFLKTFEHLYEIYQPVK